VFAGHTFADDGMGRAKHMRMGKKMCMTKQVLMMADHLDLSKEQIDKLNDLSIDSRINMIKDKAAIEVAELKLMKLMSDYDADKKAINRAVDKLYDLKKKKKNNMIDTHFKVTSILTREQFEKFKTLKIKMGMGRMSGDMRHQKAMGMEMMHHKHKMMGESEE
ncbi:MAG: hypothetical protein KAJ34_07525, partial [Thermodesulfovibrionia bacterium]|nr:hypothetical protein [Thermodesulfovibrionia bacterium]